MKRIAVIEDNPDNRLLLEAILEDRYEVAVYENGNDALRGLLRDGASLVLTDLSLPGMDGFELLRRLRAETKLRTIPVVALTAHAMAGDREECLNAGFNEYVPKPILDENALLDVVARLVAS